MASFTEENGRNRLTTSNDPTCSSIKSENSFHTSAAPSSKQNKGRLTSTESGSASQVEQHPGGTAMKGASLEKQSAANISLTIMDADAPSQVEQIPAQSLKTFTEQVTMPSALQFNLNSTLRTLLTQIAAVQLSQADLERVLKSLNTGTNTFSKATSRCDFELLPKLPIELRLGIWRYAAWHPQVIAVKDDSNPSYTALRGDTARCPLIRVNKEAREEVTKTKLNFNAECQINEDLGKPSGRHNLDQGLERIVKNEAKL